MLMEQSIQRPRTPEQALDELSQDERTRFDGMLGVCFWRTQDGTGFEFWNIEAAAPDRSVVTVSTTSFQSFRICTCI